MISFEKLTNQKEITRLFVFGMYRSGTTIIARSLAGEKNIAFASDPIRPFFNYYRSKIQKEIGSINIEKSNRPLSDYFNNQHDYLKYLLKSNFSELITVDELSEIRNQIINQGTEYSPKFVDNLKKLSKIISLNYSEELKLYLNLIQSTYGNKETSFVGLKEVWSIEMAFPILNLLGNKVKILVVLRDPLDIIASSFSGAANYSILSLVRQWRKQLVFFSFLKKIYPNSVELLNYEDFCSSPIITLKTTLQKFEMTSKIFSSSSIKPIDDFGNSWIKNSSYLNKDNSQNIDKKSIGKYKKILNKTEIEWIIYLTHMCSYKKYNHNNLPPGKPKSSFPKKNINNVAEWAKLDILSLEGDNLDLQLNLEEDRVKKMSSYSENNIKSLNFITDQI